MCLWNMFMKYLPQKCDVTQDKLYIIEFVRNADLTEKFPEK